jgi:fatty-acyl-CoA synthase
VALFATARLGAVFVPLNFRFTGGELAHNIQDSDASLLIADDAHTGPVDEVRDRLGVRHYLRTGETADGWDGVDDLLALRHTHVEEAAVDADSPALILYTSGTTGRPKGAVLTHRNVWTSNVNWMLAVNYNAEHAALTSAPLYAGTLLDDIERYRVT